MKTVLNIAVVLLISSSFLYSCKKSTAESRSQMMVGTWNVNAYGVDDNMDGMLETSEYDSIPVGAALSETYRSDGTGTVIATAPGGDPVYTNTTWKLTDGDKNLQVTTNGTVSTAVITKLTEHELQGYDQASSPRIIYLLTK